MAEKKTHAQSNNVADTKTADAKPDADTKAEVKLNDVKINEQKIPTGVHIDPKEIPPMSKCESCKFFCHHDNLYCSNTCGSWGELKCSLSSYLD